MKQKIRRHRAGPGKKGVGFEEANLLEAHLAVHSCARQWLRDRWPPLGFLASGGPLEASWYYVYRDRGTDLAFSPLPLGGYRRQVHYVLRHFIVTRSPLEDHWM